MDVNYYNSHPNHRDVTVDNVFIVSQTSLDESRASHPDLLLQEQKTHRMYLQRSEILA